MSAWTSRTLPGRCRMTAAQRAPVVACTHRSAPEAQDPLTDRVASSGSASTSETYAALRPRLLSFGRRDPVQPLAPRLPHYHHTTSSHASLHYR